MEFGIVIDIFRQKQKNPINSYYSFRIGINKSTSTRTIITIIKATLLIIAQSRVH